MDQTVLNIAPTVFWGVAGLLGAGLAMGLVWAVLWAMGRPVQQEPGALQKRLGSRQIPQGLFWLGAALWLALITILAVGLAGLIFDVLWQIIPGTEPALARLWGRVSEDNTVWEFRIRLAQLAGLTAVLGAAVALPITLTRVRLAQEQLFNEKITEAARDLYAQRQVTLIDIKDGGKKFNGWEDDITRRNAAIDRLFGLVKERPSEVQRVSRLLSVYVRELSRKYEAKDPPKTEDRHKIRYWAHALPNPRPDMENAVQMLGRLSEISDVRESEIDIDLSGSNLQKMRLRDLKFGSNANFSSAKMQGAYLFRAEMQGAILTEARMQGAVLSVAKMEGADLSRAEMQGADLIGAEMQGADLSWAAMQGADLSGAKMQGADLSGAEMKGTKLFRAKMQGADLSVAKMQWADLQQAKIKGAYLGGAEMQGAHLIRAEMQGADLQRAKMKGADLSGAEMQGAVLSWVKMDSATDLSGATLRGAALRSVDDDTLTQLRPFWADFFADGTVQVAKDERPDHWARQTLDLRFRFQNGRRIPTGPFTDAWRAWQRSIGQDPDDPR